MKHSKIGDKDTSLPDVLNIFYAQYERNAIGMVSPSQMHLCPPLPLQTSDLSSGESIPRKAMGPDGIPSHALRSSADQLQEVFTDIFNLSLLQAEVPTCFKKTTISPVPKKAHATFLNDYRPNTIYKFADDTTVVGQISNNDESEYRKEMDGL
eukprot:g40074.t1